MISANTIRFPISPNDIKRVALEIAELGKKLYECQRAQCILNLMGTVANFAFVLTLLCLYDCWTSREWRPMLVWIVTVGVTSNHKTHKARGRAKTRLVL